MHDEQRYQGLLEHLTERLGPVRSVEPARSERGNRGYDLAFYSQAEPPITTVVSNGLRFQQVAAIRPEELVCSLLPDQQHLARHLVDSIASLIIRHKQGMEYGSVFHNDRPIIEETEITGVVGQVSPLFGRDFDLFPNADAATLQLITLVPITTPEVAFIQAEGADKLFEVFYLNRTNILDVGRRSAV
ncbi:hypothetical protein CFP65_7112 [Kitasatospora sp. MMS16-BH015]|uniref:suppressor of fused domain protein n=1 Tax=Kitasatospora sp. MMS16-BH015 TaxID=2018025 RepID=UPI000CA1674F|nr:suppressor of fused domain protein [Kitasatospora sp. MMS16-BH015]AUG81714.1 hypothetical protein CFP65_7112 [Kitasatospora sp. MMS16-BH015]